MTGGGGGPNIAGTNCPGGPLIAGDHKFRDRHVAVTTPCFVCTYSFVFVAIFAPKNL